MKSKRLISEERSNRIRGMLASRGMNQTTLAAAIGIPYGTVTTVVNGFKDQPRVRKAIARFLGVTVEELFGEDGDGHL